MFNPSTVENRSWKKAPYRFWYAVPRAYTANLENEKSRPVMPMDENPHLTARLTASPETLPVPESMDPTCPPYTSDASCEKGWELKDTKPLRPRTREGWDEMEYTARTPSVPHPRKCSRA